MADLSTKPYLIRAIHAWCEDSGYRPYIAVVVDAQTQVPREFVRNGEIVLNVSAQATNRLRIGNELIEFEARFSGTVRAVSIPIENVSAIYAQETGHGMAFDVARAPVADSSIPTLPEAVRAERAPAKPRLVPTPARSDPPGKATRPDLTRAAVHAADPPAGDASPVAPAGETSTEPVAPAPRKPARAPRRRKTSPAAAEAGGPTPANSAPSSKGPAEAGSEPVPASAPSTDPGVRSIGLAEGSGSADKSARTEPPPSPDPTHPAGPGKASRGHLKRIK
ncbi:MAG: hypothetical protein RL322_1496 [Pseudomonadota bacterium]|jgi:stringent starvation protein B